jgi:signal transduction histidine kinase
VSYGLLAGVLLSALTAPYFYPTLLVGSMLAVFAALPYVAGRRLARLLGTSFAVATAMALVTHFSRHSVALPEWGVFLNEVVAVSIGAFLILLLTWQFSERLRHRSAVAEEAAQEVGEQARRLKVLSDASVVFAQMGRVPDLTIQVVAHQCALSIGDSCSVLMSDELNQLKVAAFFDRNPLVMAHAAESLFVGSRLPIFGIVAQVLATGEPRLTSGEDPSLREFLPGPPVGSLVIAPIPQSAGMSGVIALARRTPSAPLTEMDVALVQDLAHRAGLAIESARLNRDLQASVQMRDDFLAIAGHELKTPLASLLIHLESLERASLKSGEVGTAARLQPVLRSTWRLEHLINELLDVSRITAGRVQLQPEPFDLAQLVREVVQRLEQASARAHSAISLDAQPLRGTWDKLRVEQVITNLLSNALKYGAGKPVDVKVCSEGGAAMVTVADRGMGIEVEDQKRIFERFERAVSDRHFGGLGLGLWISRQVVEASGGSISVSSTVGKGATFVVRLPLDSSSAASCQSD